MSARRVVYLSGGVGGARLLDGLARQLPADRLCVVVNVGDDFQHWGLSICPDLDTVMYTLCGLSDQAQGWGLLHETHNALGMMRRYGAADWFALGDRDLATHLMRSQLLREGVCLTEVTRRLCQSLGLAVRVLPASDDPHPTLIATEHEGELSFQDWLVRRRARPNARGVRSAGSAAPTPQVLQALDDAELVLIGPSNPYVSIDPIINLKGVRERLRRLPVVAISPIVAGKAIKGPLAEMIPTLAGEPASAGAIARHYGELLDGLVVEAGDEDGVQGVRTRGAATVMRSATDRQRLAAEALDFARTLEAHAQRGQED